MDILAVLMVVTVFVGGCLIVHQIITRDRRWK
jgi:hypothetical protein